MGNYYKDNDDLRFYVERWIDWEGLIRLTEWGGGEDALANGDESLLSKTLLHESG